MDIGGASRECPQMAEPLSSAARYSDARRAAILCALVLVLEGYDLGAMAFTLPALSEAWHLRPVIFTAALTAASIGLFLGSLACGWLGDRWGRKPVLLGCVAVFGAMSLATAIVPSVRWLTFARFLTGLGIGGGIPTSIALLSDLAPPGRQGGLVMATTCGVQAGNVIGGVMAARLLAPFGWPAVFVIGGVVPLLLLLPLLACFLPESLPASAAQASLSVSSKNSIGALFADGFAAVTLFIWLINFLSLLTIYFINSWLPAMLHSLGFATAGAILAAAMFQLGGIAGGLGSGPLVNKYGTEKIVAAMLAMGSGWLVIMSIAHASLVVMACFIFATGIGISAGQLGINALSGAAYPTSVRNTGTGWALGFGRLGNIAGPLFGGLLLALGWTPRQMLLLIAVPALLLAVTLLVLAKLRQSRALTSG